MRSWLEFQLKGKPWLFLVLKVQSLIWFQKCFLFRQKKKSRITLWVEAQVNSRLGHINVTMKLRLEKIIFLKSSRLLPFYKYRQGRYTNFPWKIFGNHVVCWTFSVANKSGHFSFGSFCVISFTTQGFLWFLGNQCSRARVVQCWRLRGFSVQRIYYANRSSNRFLSAASAVLLLLSCVQPLTLHSRTFCLL